MPTGQCAFQDPRRESTSDSAILRQLRAGLLQAQGKLLKTSFCGKLRVC